LLNALKAFWKRPTTIVGIVTAVMFQIIFAVVWMTAYDGVTAADRLKQLEVGIVASDPAGRELAGKLAKELPVSARFLESGAEAEKLLNERKIQMVMTIPRNLRDALMDPQRTAVIRYSINESNPALTASLMSSIAAQTTAAANNVAVAQGLKAAFVQGKLPTVEAAPPSKRIVSEFANKNVVQGMNNQMAPMMLLLASYVGTMIMSMNIAQSSVALAVAGTGRWQLFAARNALNAAAAILVSLIGSALFMLLGGKGSTRFPDDVGLSVPVCAFLFAVIAVIPYSIRYGRDADEHSAVVHSACDIGSHAASELLSAFYHRLGAALPASHAVEGTMDILFGGSGAGFASLSLLFFILLSAGLSAIVIALRKGRMHPAVQKAGGAQPITRNG